MCGLVGVFGNLGAPDVKYFKNALVADYVRGPHSTGIFVANAKSSYWIKRAVDPCTFLDMKKVDSSITATQWVLAGHNRYATMGGVNSNNAHPFEHGDITLMHNGTLDEYSLPFLRKKFNAPVFDTDSELISWLFDNYAPKDVVAELEGAFALVWWNEADKSVNFVHNGEREFHMSVQKENVYWGSEKKMVEWIGHRTNTIIPAVDEVVSPEIGEYNKFTYDPKTRKVERYTESWEVQDTKKIGYGYGYGSGYRNTSYVSGTAAGFKQDWGIDIHSGSVLYATVDNIRPQMNNNARSVVDFKLAVEPYTTITSYYVDNAHIKDMEVGDYVSCKVSYTSGYADKVNITTSFASVNVIKDEKAFKDLDAWVTKHSVIDVKAGEVVPFDPKFVGFQGKLIEYGEFKEVLDKGCALCGTSLHAEDEKFDQTSVFIDDTAVVCEECSKNTEALAYFGIVIGE